MTDCTTTAGPLVRHPRRRPVPRAGRPARHDDARRPRRPGDQGRGARRRATTPAAGDRRSSRPRIGRRRRRESTYFLSANRNKESITLDLKDDGDRQVLLGPGPPRRRAGRELPHRGARPARASASSTLHELNPRLVVLSITGFGHDGPEGGRAGYDQIAQGEAGLMSLTGSGPDDPQKVGHADRRPAGRACTAPTACWPRCSSASAPARARWCAPRCWPRPSACTPSRAPAGPWPARSAAPRATTTRRSPRTACSTAPTASCRSRWAAKGSGGGSAPGSTSTRPRPGWRPTRSGWPTGSG